MQSGARLVCSQVVREQVDFVKVETVCYPDCVPNNLDVKRGKQVEQVLQWQTVGLKTEGKCGHKWWW